MQIDADVQIETRDQSCDSSRQFDDFAVFDGSHRLPNSQVDGIRNKPRGAIRHSNLNASRMPAPRGGHMVRRRCHYRVCRANSDEEDSTFPYTITGKENRRSALLGPVAVKI